MPHDRIGVAGGNLFGSCRRNLKKDRQKLIFGPARELDPARHFAFWNERYAAAREPRTCSTERAVDGSAFTAS